MVKKSRSMKKTLTILTILALLVLILPVAVMAKAGGWTPVLPGQASENAATALKKPKTDTDVADLDEDKDEDEVKDEVEDVAETEEDMKSEQALFIAARNDWAKNVAGISPGHANLLIKLWASMPDHVMPATFESIKADLSELMGANLENGKIDVKLIMSKINGKDLPTTTVTEAAPKGNEKSQVARTKEKNNPKK